MRPAKLKTNYDYITNDRLPRFAGDVVMQTTASTYWPDGDKLAKPVADKLAELMTALNETAHPSPSQNAWRDELRGALRDELGVLGATLNLAHTGQEAALLASGLELVEVPVIHKEPTEHEPITEMEVVNGPRGSGLLTIRFKRPPKAVQMVCRYSDDAQLPEDHWCVCFGGPREITLGPFGAGTRVGLKLGALFTGTTLPDYTAVQWYYVQE